MKDNKPLRKLILGGLSDENPNCDLWIYRIHYSIKRKLSQNNAFPLLPRSLWLGYNDQQRYPVSSFQLLKISKTSVVETPLIRMWSSSLAFDSARIHFKDVSEKLRNEKLNSRIPWTKSPYPSKKIYFLNFSHTSSCSKSTLTIFINKRAH